LLINFKVYTKLTENVKYQKIFKDRGYAIKRKSKEANFKNLKLSKQNLNFISNFYTKR